MTKPEFKYFRTKPIGCLFSLLLRLTNLFGDADSRLDTCNSFYYVCFPFIRHKSLQRLFERRDIMHSDEICLFLSLWVWR
mmetsp:Transcript_19980/g.49716  ORF Transcript_19980/g.49716 Transcript_19980/m.49716 type:complete len:80 (-) Transcript_19980:72-311(-)